MPNWKGKVQEAWGVFVGASVGAFLSLAISDSADYDYGRALWVFTFVVVFYYLYTSNKDGINVLENTAPREKIFATTVFLSAFTIFVNLLYGFLYMVTGLDYCDGWAYSEKHCAIQKIQERYYVEPYDPGY